MDIPIAVDINPSIPLAPLLENTLIFLSILNVYESRSLIGEEFPINKFVFFGRPLII